MGNKISNSGVSPRAISSVPENSMKIQYKRALSRITASKVGRIRQIFDELTRQSSTSGERVDKASFLRYFPLPGMMGERLFSVFDRDGNGSIDFQEFLTGLTMIYHGTVEDKKKFLFCMYDLDGNGEVTKDELFTMLSHIPSAFKMLQLYEPPLEEKGGVSAVTTHHPSPQVEERVRKIVDSVFEGKSEGETLSFDEFQLAVSRNSAISEIINIFYNEALPENELALDARDEPLVAANFGARKSSSTLQASNLSRGNSEVVCNSPKQRCKCPLCETTIQFKHCIRCGSLMKGKQPVCGSCGIKLPEPQFCFACGHPLRSTFDQRGESSENSESEDDASSVGSGTSSPKGGQNSTSVVSEGDEICGFLSKIGRTTQTRRTRFFILRDCFLYYYSSNSDETLKAPPKGVIFLSGVIVSSMSSRDNQAGHFGFIIKSGAKKRKFFCNGKEDQERWMSALLRASRTRVISDYYNVETDSPPIGRGKFSVVYAGTSRTNKAEVAVKVLDAAGLEKQADDREFIRSELAIVKLVSHPNIVKTIDVFEELDKIFIVMELVRGGDLLSKLQRSGRFSEFDAKRTILSLTQAIQYLHAKGIIHRDIKPENVLISEEGVVKVADFGLSALLPHTGTLEAPLGTVGYAAPEVLLSMPYDKSVDLWSLGALTYVVLAGQMPFRGASDKEIAMNVVKAKYSFSTTRAWDDVSVSGKDFITKLLVKDPSKRMTAVEALHHEWLAL